MTGVQPSDFAPVAVVARSGVDESVHFGAVVGLGTSGSVELSAGNRSTPIYPRSSTKPLQALAMVRAGLTLPAEQLALVCASHNGENIHLDTARAILASVGLDESHLGNTADHPLHQPSAHEALRSGRAKSPLQMNCSGKHSGMLATCVVNGWSLDGYLEQDHPLQLAITHTIAEMTGEDPIAIGTDGCGAPAHVVRLEGLARAMRTIASGGAGEQGRAIHAAMSGHPYMVGGADRNVTALMQAVPGLMAKDGAESVYIAAHADGRAVALKLADGSGRATITVMVDTLRRLGVDVAHDAPGLTETVLGHGKPVGGVRSVAFGDGR